jgi:hypothetical protein
VLEPVTTWRCSVRGNPLAFLAAATLVLSAGCITAAQAVSAECSDIRGRVTDDRGNPVTWASVYTRGGKVGGSTDSQGYYHISCLPAGEYYLIVAAAGFRRATLGPVTVHPPDTLFLDPKLEPACRTVPRPSPEIAAIAAAATEILPYIVHQDPFLSNPTTFPEERHLVADYSLPGLDSTTARALVDLARDASLDPCCDNSGWDDFDVWLPQLAFVFASPADTMCMLVSRNCFYWRFSRHSEPLTREEHAYCYRERLRSIVQGAFPDSIWGSMR